MLPYLSLRTEALSDELDDLQTAILSCLDRLRLLEIGEHERRGGSRGYHVQGSRRILVAPFKVVFPSQYSSPIY